MKRRDIFKCEICGNISTTEKHVPIIEKTETGVKATVGSTLHPMTDDHFIEWIEVINGEYNQRKYLKPGEEPVAEFYIPFSDKLVAREYCNVHGNWTTKKKEIL